MDLEKMTHKLNNYEYTTKEAFIVDFKLMISNCQTYNQPETTYYRCAEAVDAAFEKLMAQHFTQITQ
jgi:hypothetical protein